MAPSISTPIDDVMSPPETAKYIHLSVSMTAKLRCKGGGPTYFKLGRAVRYRRSDLDAWLNSRRVHNTSDAARLPTRLTDAEIESAPLTPSTVTPDARAEDSYPGSLVGTKKSNPA